MPLYQTQAIALHERPAREADRLVTLFTQRQGCVLVKAAGIARSKSKYGSAMELLCHTDVLLHKKREDQTVYRLTQCTILQTHAELRADLTHISISSLIAEAIERLSHRDEPQPLLWALLVRTLAALHNPPDPWPVLVCYLLHLLRCTGYAPQLDRCVRTGSEPRGETLFFSARDGGIVAADARHTGERLLALDHDTWLSLRTLAQARLARLPEEITFPSSRRKQLWDLLDQLWQTHLDWDSRALRLLRSLES